jgi:hypothetical protein
MELASVEHVLDALEARGAGAFDAISCSCARQLIVRANTFEARARALLAARANDHVARLGQRFELAGADVIRRIEAAEKTHGPLPQERAAYARGELSNVRRALRRRNSAPVMRDDSAQLARRMRCADEYHASLSDLLATFAVASAVDFVPEQAGPYNPLRIASDLLERIRSVSPIYLNAQLRRLEELASMLALPVPAQLVGTTPPRKGRRTSKPPKR